MCNLPYNVPTGKSDVSGNTGGIKAIEVATEKVSYILNEDNSVTMVPTDELFKAVKSK